MMQTFRIFAVVVVLTVDMHHVNDMHHFAIVCQIQLALKQCASMQTKYT